MDDSLRIYRRSPFQDEAQQLCDDLVTGGVPARLRTNSDVVDVTFSGRPAVEYHVMVPHDRFIEADEVLVRMAPIALEEVRSDHHLRALTQAELMEAVERPDEWSVPDVEVARLLLKERGVEVSEQEVRVHFQERMLLHSRPEPAPWEWVMLGYELSFLGGLFGAFIGWSLFTGHKTLPNGDRRPLYDADVRLHGRLMFGLGIVMLILTVVTYFRGPA